MTDFANESKEEICECGHKQWEEHKSFFYNYKGLKMIAQECNVKGCKCKKFRQKQMEETKDFVFKDKESALNAIIGIMMGFDIDIEDLQETGVL